jgi:hypothetical protein
MTLVSELQNQFPNDALEVNEKDSGLVAKVVALIERLDQPWTCLSIHVMDRAGMWSASCRRVV